MPRLLLSCSRLAALAICGACAFAVLTRCTRTRRYSEDTTVSPADTTEAARVAVPATDPHKGEGATPDTTTPPAPTLDSDEECYPGPCPSPELVERACRNTNQLERSGLDIDGYFETRIYAPAMRDAKVPEANRRFLRELRAYRKALRAHERAVDASDEGYLPPPNASFIRGVYREHDDFELDDTGMLGEPGTSFDRSANPRVHVIGIDSVVQAKVGASRPFQAPCASYPTHPLRSAAFQRQKMPLVATKAAIELEFRSDARMNEMLADHNWCRNLRSYCDPITEHTTFAALAGVPGLYLSHSDGWFPARGIAMNIDDQYAVLLWEFSFELIECTCI